MGLSASWAIIQSYATTLPSGPTGLTCSPTQTPGSCVKFYNDIDNPLTINLVRSSLIGTGTVTVSSQAKALLQNVANVTGSMDLQAHLAETLPSNKISNIKINNSSSLTTGLPLVSTVRTDAGVTAQDGNIEVSLTVDKSIQDGEYIIKIATILVPDTMQTFDKTNPIYSSITPVNGSSTEQARTNATITLPDARDNKLYRIRKFTTHPNNQSAPNTTTAWWWMIDNLAFDLLDSEGNPSPYAPIYNPAPQHIVGGQTIDVTDEMAQYVTTGAGLTTDMGYLYTWRAAVADQSTNCTDSRSIDDNATMPNSICPAGTSSPWRLPKGNSDDNLNDFAWLNGLMNGDTAASIDDTFLANWLPTGVWQGSLSGYYDVLPINQGYDGFYWSSTAVVTEVAFELRFEDDHVYIYSYDNNYYGHAIRCVI